MRTRPEALATTHDSSQPAEEPGPPSGKIEKASIVAHLTPARSSTYGRPEPGRRARRPLRSRRLVLVVLAVVLVALGFGAGRVVDSDSPTDDVAAPAIVDDDPPEAGEAPVPGVPDPSAPAVPVPGSPSGADPGPGASAPAPPDLGADTGTGTPAEPSPPSSETPADSQSPPEPSPPEPSPPEPSAQPPGPSVAAANTASGDGPATSVPPEPATGPPTAEPQTRDGIVNGCNTYGENCDGNPIYRELPGDGFDWRTWPQVAAVDNGTSLTARCWSVGALHTNYQIDPLDLGEDPYDSHIHFNVLAPNGEWGWIPDVYFVRDEVNRLGLPHCDESDDG
jgi:hypothetical protein